MRNLIIFIIFLGILSPSYSQNGLIKGKIIPEVKSEIDFIKNNSKVYMCNGCDEYSTTLDEDLNFEFENVNSGDFEIWIEPPTTFNYLFTSGKLKGNDTLNLRIPIAYSCKYDQSKKDNTCPVCQKKNRVIPMVYGLIVGKGAGRKYILAGCFRMGCEPNWYCKRDKIEF